MKIAPVALIGLLLSLSLGVSAADVYKWKDAQGRTHFGDRPTQDAEKITVKPGSGEDPSIGETGRKELEALKMQDKKYANCKQKREQLETWKKATRIVEQDGLGREKEYNADEKAQLVQRAQSAYEKECAGV